MRRMRKRRDNDTDNDAEDESSYTMHSFDGGTTNSIVSTLQDEDENEDEDTDESEMSVERHPPRKNTRATEPVEVVARKRKGVYLGYFSMFARQYKRVQVQAGKSRNTLPLQSLMMKRGREKCSATSYGLAHIKSHSTFRCR
jgi:hypothetical protein